MAGAGLIDEYVAELSRRLPAAAVAELADGVNETYASHLERGQAATEAARTAIAEFGAPDVIAAAFVTVSPGRRTARTLLLSGPVVGGCWALTLLAGRAWTWPAPGIAGLLLPAAVVSVVLLIVTASFARRYRLTQLAAVAGCLGIVALDAGAVGYVAAVVPTSGWPVLLAVTASMTRLAFAATRVPAVVKA